MGRLAAHWCEVGTRTILIWNLYGWTGGATCEEAAQRSDDLFQIIKEETAQHEDVLSVIAADVNATDTDLPTLLNLTQTDQWIDVGAVASKWGGKDNEMTCKASKISKATRIDRIFVNNLLFPAVRGFQVDTCDEYPAHQPLQLRLEAGALSSNVDKHRKTTNASKLFEQRILEEHGKHSDQSVEQTRKQVLGQMHSAIDHEVAKRHDKLTQAAAKGDTTAIWRSISSASEVAFSDFVNCKEKPAVR